MKYIKRLKPYEVDLLVYKFSEGSSTSIPIELPFPVEEKIKDTYVFMDGKTVAHKSKVFRGSRILNSFGFKERMICIGDCETPESYRGQGLYPKMLRHLFGIYKAQYSIFILVHPSNAASIRGIEKSGCSKVARIKCTKVGLLYFNKEIERID